jgi:signal transduction histidine kinase
MLIPQGASDDALIGLNRLATVARLLSGAAHDVNNALQVISGTVEIVQMRTDLPSAAADALDRVRAQTARAAGALHRVNAFTRAPHGPIGPINLRELVEDSLALRDFAIRRARVSARLEAGAGTTYVVTGNRGDLQQVLLNLIINAEEALAGVNGTDVTGTAVTGTAVNGTIVVRLGREGDRIVVRVVDEGPGIGVDPPERAFEPFVTGGRPFETAGLGLWVCRRLVEQHGGTLDIEYPAIGTALVVRLPAAPGCAS